MTFILGLTGSIGMGKSATSALFRAAGIPVHDADLAVHAAYAAEAVAPIEAAFPGTVQGGVVDRARLGAIVLGDPARLRQLEAIVHPIVRAAGTRFLAQHSGRPLVVLDVPLLLETGGAGRCDAVVVVTAAAALQRERVLARPGMNAAKLDAILAKQMPDAEKRRRAHFLVETDHGFAHAGAEVSAILAALAGRPGRAARRLSSGDRL
jgi:dephospho-CoA kinase